MYAQEMETPEHGFRFENRREYERELVHLATVGDDEEYESLAEEYIRFCDAESDA